MKKEKKLGFQLSLPVSIFLGIDVFGVALQTLCLRIYFLLLSSYFIVAFIRLHTYCYRLARPMNRISLPL